MDTSPTDAGDLRLGKRAVDRGLITLEQLRDALVHHARLPVSDASAASRFGLLLREKGFITAAQLETLLQEDRIASDPRLAASRSLGTFGKFALSSEVGRGGMGLVYDAHDTDLDRRVALKVLLSSPNADPKERELDEERFVREARLSAKLKHPNIVTVYEAGVIHGRRYIAMEFIDGLPLSEWRRKGSITVRQQGAILRDVALAVHHAHEQGIVHRDLKPGNVLLDAKNQPHVADFGLGKFLGRDVVQSFSAEGRVVGTPAYMSPEQMRGSASLDRRADVYSMGVMLYEILTGRLPFDGQSASEVMFKAANDPVKEPSKITTIQFNPAVFGALEAICLKAMARRADDRYADARKLAEDLTRWLQGQSVRASSRWPGVASVLEGAKKRRQWLAAGVVVLLAAAGLTGLLIGIVSLAFRSRPAETPAPAPAAVAAAPAPVPARMSVTFDAASSNADGGIRLRLASPGEGRLEAVDGSVAVRPVRTDGQPGFLHFDVDDAWAATVPMAELEIQYFDAGPAWSAFTVEYDSMDPRWPHEGTYKRAGLVLLEGSRRWRVVRLLFTCPRLENRMDLGSDFRLGTDKADLMVRRVELRPWTPPVAFAGPPVAVESSRLRSGLPGEYHAGVHLADPRRRVIDPDLSFDNAAAAWEGGPSPQFSIRWSGGVRVPAKGRYLVDVQSDDGVRVFVGGSLVISNWTAHAPMTDGAVCDLDAGFYPLQVEYFEQGGGAFLRVAWFRERAGRMVPVDAPLYVHAGSK